MKKVYFLLLLLTGIAFAQPPIGTPVDLHVCEDTNGFGVFNLTPNTPIVLDGLNPGLYSVHYYLTQADADSSANFIPNPTNFTSSGQVIYVRLEENANPTNFSTAHFNLIISPLPIATISGSSTICAGQNAMIFFTGTPNAIVTYTGDGSPQTILLGPTGTASLMTPILMASTTYSLLSVSSTPMNCIRPLAGSATVLVVALPTAQITTPDQTTCNGNGIEVTFQGSGGTAPFTFTYAINGGAVQNITSDVNGFATLLLPQLTEGDHIVQLISVYSSGPLNCYQNVSDAVHITVQSSLTTATPPDLYVADDPFDGVAAFDLTSNDSVLMNGNFNITTTYFESQANAELGTPPIIPATNYTGTNGQKVWVRVQNQLTGCNVVKSFRLFVVNPNAPNDYIFIPDPSFKSALITIGVDTNNDGQIQYVEAAAVTQLTYFSNLGISDLTGINSFPNLTSANFNGNQIEGILNISNLVNLTNFECNDNQITGINLPVSGTMTQLFCGNNQITSLDVSGNTGLQTLYCVNNEISSLIFTPSLVTVSCGQNNLMSLNLNSLANLQLFSCTANPNLTSLTATGLTNLLTLQCNNNPALLSVNVSGCTGLNELSTDGNTIMNSLNVTGCIGLDYLSCPNNQLTTLDASNLPTLVEIRCNNNQLTSLNISGCTALKSLYCNNNQLTSLNVSGTTVLEALFCNNNQLATLTAPNQTHLTVLSCNENPPLTSVNLSGCSALMTLYLSGLGQLNTLNVSGCTAMMAIQCNQNALTSLNLSGLASLQTLDCQNNQIEDLNLTNCSVLSYLTCFNNNLSELDLSDSPQISNLNCAENDLTILDVSNLTHLLNLNCTANQLTTLDVSNSAALLSLDCGVNSLETLFVKNGVNEVVNFQLNPNLVYICADVSQVTSIANAAGPTVQVNSYCSFNPGGDYNTISGAITFDSNNNGCGPEDVPQPFIKVNITDASTTGATFTNAASNYAFYTGTGSFQLTPELENQAWFTISPTSPTITFADDNNNTVTQNFCIAPNGSHQDLEIVVAPVLPARPGFIAVYKLVYKNKGNTILPTNPDGIILSYNNQKLSFLNSDTTPSGQSTNSINWSYETLLPFESRSILVTFHVNAPTDPNPVNIGDILHFTAGISPNNNDETVADNTFLYSQAVVGSYDPNDITCLEGDVVSPVQIGKYLHYIINFENTGNFEAENIVVRDIIDTDKYDVQSLQIMDSSDAVTVRVTGNVAEFVFQNIHLHSGGHGNILLKLKSDNALVQGDTVSKRADIFFDYNAPIATEMANTTFQLLSNPTFPTDASIVLYPNPTKGNINIQADHTIQSVQLFDVQGRLLQTKLVSENNVVLDITSHSTGVYFIKVTTDKGIKVEKIVRE